MRQAIIVKSAFFLAGILLLLSVGWKAALGSFLLITAANYKPFDF